MQYLMRRYAGEDGYVPILSRIWIMVLIITIAFVSVHTTSVTTQKQQLAEFGKLTKC